LTNSATLGHRLTIWRSSLALWWDYPWLGVGPGGFFWRYPAYLPIGALDEPNLYHPHNLWLELATGWGVLGLVWLGVLLTGLTRCVQTVRHATDPHKWLHVGLLAALAATLAHAQVDAFLALPDLALWLWLVLALLNNNFQLSVNSGQSHCPTADCPTAH
jgi:O-antigen ligase